MKFEEIAEKAFKQQDLPSTANLAEKYSYLQLFYLYKDYRKTLIDKEIAQKQKIQIEKEFNENQRRIDNYYQVFKEKNDIKKQYNDYIISIEKSKNQDEVLENSLKFIEKIISDDSFYNRNIKK